MTRTPTFTELDVADAGLAVCAGRGWSEVSLRSVAGVIGVSPMAVYRVAVDAEALKRSVADRAGAGLTVKAEGAWGAVARSWSISAHRRLRGLPGLATYLLSTWTELPTWAGMVEALLAAAGGDDLRMDVARVNAVFGYTLARAQLADVAAPERALAPVLADPDRFPRMYAARREFVQPRIGRHFVYGLDALLAGVGPDATACS